VGLGFLPGNSTGNNDLSSALAVSADGSTVVGADTIGAFIWDPTNGMRDLTQLLKGSGVDLSGWSLIAATGVSADGTAIVGSGTDPSGNNEAWLAILPIPEPGTLLLLGSGIAGLVLFGRTKRG